MSTYLDLVNGIRRRLTAIATSAGAGDAGKLVRTSADGKLDPSLINSATPGVWGAWQNLTLQNSWLSESGWFTNPNQVRRAGDLVEIKLAVKNSLAGISSVICTLASEFRPNDRYPLTGYSSDGNLGTSAGLISVLSNGEVRLNQSAGGQQIMVIRQTFWRV